MLSLQKKGGGGNPRKNSLFLFSFRELIFKEFVGILPLACPCVNKQLALNIQKFYPQTE